MKNILCRNFCQNIFRVIKSRNGQFPIGTLVKSSSGWRTHFLSKDGKDLQVIPYDLDSLSPSVTLNVLGMPGYNQMKSLSKMFFVFLPRMTAYFGLRLCEPKKGDICVVNGAAGAVGSIVGQLAKLKVFGLFFISIIAFIFNSQGLKVIGFAGSDEKCEWLIKELNFDDAFNYKKISLDNALKRAAPNGVDVFFDNVCFKFFQIIVRLNKRKHFFFIGWRQIFL